MQLFFKIMEE